MLTVIPEAIINRAMGPASTPGWSDGEPVGSLVIAMREQVAPQHHAWVSWSHR